MSKPWAEMTPRERNVLVAEAMGQTDFAHPGFYWTEGATEDGRDGWDGFSCPRCGASESERASPCIKSFTTSLDAASLVEDEIARRGLWSVYCQAWLEIIDVRVGTVVNDLECLPYGTDAKALMAFLRASPDVRCQAAVKVLQEQ